MKLFLVAVEIMNRLYSANRSSENGQGLVEYALILVLVALVVIIALALLGPNISNIFSQVSNALVPYP
jgi:pilus assembly protein Flp/PilA